MSIPDNSVDRDPSSVSDTQHEQIAADAGAGPTQISRYRQTTIDTQLQRATSTTLSEPFGVQFVSWLRDSIQSRRLIINDAKALVHTVAGTAFLVSPGLFQRYVLEHPEVARVAKQTGIADWAWVQKQFEKLRLHSKQENGLNIRMCEVTGPRKTRRLHGYLLLDGHTLFSDLPCDNPYLKLLTPDSAVKSDAA